MLKELDSLSKSLYFLSEEEVKFFESLASFIVPPGKDPEIEPGAKEVGAITYIDSTLADFPPGVQNYFRTSIKTVNDYSLTLFSKPFINLNDDEKDTVLRRLYLNPATREKIFDLRSLALESFYSDYHDPSYNGVTGWQVVHFGGKRISDMKKDWSFLKVWRDHNDLETTGGTKK